MATIMPMARWPDGPAFCVTSSDLGQDSGPSPFSTCMAQCVLLKTRVLNVSTESCWSMLKILMVFHVEKRIPMLIVECRDSCQSWQWRLSFRTLIRLGPLWWTNSHWENLAPWLAPVRHRHPYTAPVHGTRTQHSQPWTKPRPFDIRLHSNGFDTFRRAYTHVSFMSCFLLPEEPLHLQSEIYKFVRVLCVQKPCMVKPF